jgi:CheY-like chemotaxis protein
MGLPLAKGLVEAHDGQIGVTSKGHGRGSTFFVHLPTIKASSQASKSRSAARSQRRILIVEDNRDTAALIKTVLEQAGHTVEVCHSGEDALQSADDFQPEVVLCDIGLPGQLDGFDVARGLRADDRFSHTMLVAMTGYGSKDVRQTSIEAGFDTHLVKPVDLQTIESVLSRGRKTATQS